MTKKRKKKSLKSKLPDNTFEYVKCCVYGIILVTLLLVIGNQHVFLNAATKLLRKMHLITKVYEPDAEKDPHLSAILTALRLRMEKSYGNPYRISTFKKPETKHRNYIPPGRVVGPYEVDYLYYAPGDVSLKTGDWEADEDSMFDAYGTNRHAARLDAAKIESERLRSVLPGLDDSLNPALRYQGSFLDLSGKVQVDHHGIWRKEKKEQTEVNTYNIEDHEAFKNLEPLAECPKIETKWNEKVEPQYKTDPDKHLTGTYIWGPNNQSRGLREIVFMALKMNRTLALPPFFKHWGTDTTIEKKSTPTGAYTRLDVDFLRTLLPIVQPEEMAKKCKHKIDAFWAARRDYCHGDKVNRIHYFSEELGYEDLNITDTDHLNLETYHCIIHNKKVFPEWQTLPSKKGILLPTSDAGLAKVYPDNDKYKCTMFVMPYRVFNFKDVMIEDEKLEAHAEVRAGLLSEDELYPEINSPEDQQLMGEVVRATLRPLYVRNVAQKFATDMLGGANYVAIHWRYNIGDWTRHCRKKPSIQCDIVQRIVSDVEFVAENIVTYVQTYNYLESKQMKHKNFMEGKFAAGYFEDETEKAAPRPDAIYISHPPDQINFVDGIKQHIQKIAPEFKVISGRDSFSYFSKYFSNCKEILDELHDMHSMIDQEMCLRSQTFLWAVGSSWSTNVLLERHLHGNIHGDAKNTDIFQLALMTGK